ncbi:helix-turn-helix domain-containing protein [Fulvivirgaceae bacterium BMA10]|uniref:Helix-turn-helix domain-containing protein n=1 Tax=Splendidivirga corallicola TaxID=3051826 RepID=A0ABT8KK55_9BACT|nr:helix-turn-helix domain-containing protein [Fulvivirgaceae bacterium BMA10]
MEASLDNWTTIFLIAAAQGFFLVILLLVKEKQLLRAKLSLTAIILLFTLSLLYYVAYWTKYEQYFPGYISYTLGFTFVIGPLMLYYLRTLEVKQKMQFSAWHSIPIVLYSIHYFLRFFVNRSSNSFLSLSSFYTSEALSILIILQNIHLIVYTILCFYEVNKHNSSIQPAKHTWKRKVVFAFSGFTLSFFSYYVMVWTNTLKIEYDYMVSFAMSFFIYFIGYHAFTKPEILQTNGQSGKYEKSALTKSASKTLANKLIEHIKSQKSYLKNSLKLQDLAAELNLSSHHLSQIINEQLGQSYSDFLNTYRIEEAKRILSDPENANQKIISVAYDCGYNNKVSFHNTFKKYTGYSPTKYRELSLKNTKALAEQ